MEVFGVELTGSNLRAMVEHAERDYPVEACGVGLGERARAALHRVVPLKNVQDRYHQKDPLLFPRTGRDAFRVDELERMRLLEGAEGEGLEERVLYHSHCDAGAYFSPEDRAMAVRDGIELMPGAVYVVISVREGRARDAAAFRWDDETKRFTEVRVPLGPFDPEALPDLALRGMEARDSSRPIRPIGGALVPRRLTAQEIASFAALAEGRRVVLDRPESVSDVHAFARGLYSPVEGFMRSAEVRAVEHRGRLPAGTPWRVPITLEVPKSAVPRGTAVASVVELASPDDVLLALMVLIEQSTHGKDRVRLGGPIYAAPPPAGVDVAEHRAELLRLGAERVLAVPKGGLERARSANLDEFDALLAAEPVGDRPTLDFPEPAHPWLAAAVAQNLGATHLWVADRMAEVAIAGSLEIRAWSPGRS